MLIPDRSLGIASGAVSRSEAVDLGPWSGPSDQPMPPKCAPTLLEPGRARVEPAAGGEPLYGLRPVRWMTRAIGIPASTMPVPSMSMGWPQQKTNFMPMPAAGMVSRAHASLVIVESAPFGCGWRIRGSGFRW